MLRRLCLAAGLLAAAIPAAAQTSVYETAQGSATTHAVLVTNTAVVNVDSSTRTLNGFSRFILELWNDDATNNAFCGFNVNVSSLTTLGIYGRRIPARTSWVVAVPSAVPVYCVGDVAGGVQLVLTQLH